MAKLNVISRILCCYVCCYVCCSEFVSALTSPQPVISFNQSGRAYQLAGPEVGAPTIFVTQDDLYGVQRAARDLAVDFGRVTGTNAIFLNVTSLSATSGPVIIVGSITTSSLIQDLVCSGKLDTSAIEGQWEAFTTTLVPSPAAGISEALVIAGADKRGTIYGVYDISQQLGVSPWYFWADVPPKLQSEIYALSTTKVQGSPSVKYRGFFLNDEQPALTNWIQNNFPPVQYGAGFGHAFYTTVFELLLRLRANYLWPAQWNLMFNVDDPLNQLLADEYCVVMGTSHTEPMMRATKEQSLFLDGVWSWPYNQDNVTNFMRYGAERARPYESLYTMGMRGLGDVASPTLNASELEEIISVQQGILQQVYNETDISNIPQMWCLYKEVGGYFAQGLTVPEDITLLWSDDNWGNAQRLPLANETSRGGGAGLYYHFDYVGDPRDYKWINTISLPKTKESLTQAYDRYAREIWIFNVGDLKPLEIPINHVFDLAYDISQWAAPDSTGIWINTWATENFGAIYADKIEIIMLNYSILAENVLQEWANLAALAQSTYDSLPASAQPAFFEMLLHPVLAGMTVNQIHINAAKNNLYSQQRRQSTNAWAATVLDEFAYDRSLTNPYHALLNGKWNHMMDQTHLYGTFYSYWQQSERNTLPLLGYVQQSEISLAGLMGVTCDGNNGTVPGDDVFHSLSSNNLALPPMDPYGPNRWIDIFARGDQPFNFSITTGVPYVTAKPSSGTLEGIGSANATDVRSWLTVDWDNAPTGSTTITINITTNSGGFYPFNQQYPYGNYGMPSITLHLNNTAVPAGFHGFVDSDAHVSIEPEHFTTNVSADNSTAYYAVIPSYGRTLSGVTLLPYTAPSQSTTDPSAPKLGYSFYCFERHVNTTAYVYIGTTLNTDPTRPLKYAISIDNETPQVIQPIPSTVLGTLPRMWTAMVSNATTYNTTQHTISEGAHTLNLWALEPGLTFQKIVLDFGGLRQSYLGPPESVIV